MSANENFYRFDDVTIDCEDFRVQKNGQNITLTPRAFDVLLFLIKNGGRVVEKQEIFDQVWKDTFVGDNALTKIVKEIRHALADNAGNPRYIETVPKRGYRFLPEVRRVEAEEGSSKFKVQSSKSEIQNSDEIESLPSANFPPAVAHYETKRSGNVVTLAKWRHEAGESGEVGNREETDAEERHGEAETRRRGENEVESRTESKFLNLFKQNKRITIFIAASFIIVAIALFARSRFSDNQPQTSDAPIDSIAVLPFENAAQDANAEYLSDGITESLINRLSQLSNLKVMSGSSVFRYKGKAQDTNKVGNELNVRAVLTGSVKQIGDQFIINVRLDDAQNNRQIWGEQYVRKFADVLLVQNEIAQEVSSNLRVKLTSADERQLAKRYTENVEAYQLYLKGQYEWNKHTLEDLRKGIEYFNQALEKDPNYALAYAGLSACYGALGNNYLPPPEAFPKAKAYAAKALAIDDTLAEAHGVMGAVRLFYDWDWAEAEKEFKRAQTLDPNNVGAHQLYGDCLEVTGRFDETKAERKRALELDPLSPMQNMVAGATFYFAGQSTEAIVQLEKTINLESHFYPAYFYLGQAYEQKKMYPEAIATFQKGITQAERHPQLIAALGHAYALSGERDKAQKALNELREMSKRRYVSPYLFAVVYVGLGDKDQALAWLEKAYNERTFFLIWLKVEPRFDSLRDDPRFQDLLRRIGLQP